jgi:hypothetical protein
MIQQIQMQNQKIRFIFKINFFFLLFNETSKNILKMNW